MLLPSPNVKTCSVIGDNMSQMPSVPPKTPSERVITIPVELWAAAAVVASVLLFRATAHNPFTFYIHLRWIVMLVSLAGACAAFNLDVSGWAVVLAAVAFIYNPILALQFSRPTWNVINIATAIVLVAAVLFLGVSVRWRWVLFGRRATDVGLLSIFCAAWTTAILDVLLILVLLPISYMKSGDESLVNSWTNFRDAHRIVIYAITTAIVAAIYAYRLRQYPTEAHGRNEPQPVASS
jgi:hypothetical protein